jgi:RNA polymerase sigma-70 factor, ECF subfamily
VSRKAARAVAVARPAGADRQSRMRALIDQHVGFVARTLQRAGVPRADLDDEVQRTFIAAARRLDDVRIGAERRFLFRVAQNMALHTRRRLGRRREVLTDTLPEAPGVFTTPEHMADRRQMGKLVGEIVASLDESMRQVFTLYELQEMDMAEIATHLGVPRGTVASRLRRARAQLRKHAAAIELAWDLGSEGAKDIEEPVILQRRSVSRLEHALLGAGTSTPASGATLAKTLAALGFS